MPLALCYNFGYALVMPNRDRSQLLVALGEGAAGKKLRRAVASAAKQAGLPPSTWVRGLVLDALISSGLVPAERVATSRSLR